MNVWVIIDPHWNLERTKFIYITSRKNGNNRSTLEFRADISDPRLKSLVVIIDPHWNLESRIDGCFHIVVLVIIDPHWNLELCQSRDTGPCRPGNNRSTLEFRGCKRKIL